MKKRIVEIEGRDGSEVELEVTSNYPLRMWEEEKCWSLLCLNPIYFIKLNKKGQGMKGYCFHLNREIQEKIGIFKLRKDQKWVHIEQGKLVIDKEG